MVPNDSSQPPDNNSTTTTVGDRQNTGVNNTNAVNINDDNDPIGSQLEQQDSGENISLCKRIIRRCIVFATTCGEPKPHKHRWWLVISNIGFFVSAIVLLFINSKLYLFDSIVILYMGIVSTIFHSVQCTKGHRHETTQKFCAIDVISCFAIGLYLFIRYSTSIFHTLVFCCVLPFFIITGKYYIAFHSLWHILGGAFLALVIAYRDQSNFFTYKWWTF